MIQNLTNFALFQGIYFACVLGAAQGRPWIGAIVAMALLPCNLWFFPKKLWPSEISLWALAGAVGLVADSGLYAFGLIGFPELTLPQEGTGVWSLLAPPWIVALWVTVGSALNGSLAWLRGRWKIAALLGAVGGPFSFWSGARLGATELPLGHWSILALSIEYAVLFPVLIELAASHAPAPAPAPSIDAL